MSNRRIDSLESGLNRNIDQLRVEMNQRFTGMDALFTEKLKRVEEAMDARLKHLEERLKVEASWAVLYRPLSDRRILGCDLIGNTRRANPLRMRCLARLGFTVRIHPEAG